MTEGSGSRTNQYGSGWLKNIRFLQIRVCNTAHKARNIFTQRSGKQVKTKKQEKTSSYSSAHFLRELLQLEVGVDHFQSMGISLSLTHESKIMEKKNTQFRFKKVE
jgi:hypothetical protein